MPAIQLLCDGLKLKELLLEIRKNPVGFKDLFVSGMKLINLGRFLEELEPAFSPPGSNHYTKEEICFKVFCDFAEKCYMDGELPLILLRLRNLKLFKCY